MTVTVLGQEVEVTIAVKHEEINYDGLGKGFNELIPEDMKGVMAFGMIPHDFFNQFLDMIREKIATIAQKNGQYTDIPLEVLAKAVDGNFMREVEDKFSKAIYRHAKMVV